MKKFYYYDENECECELIVGNAREIKSLYKNMIKKTNFIPIFTECPYFNKNNMYGIDICDGQYTIVTNNDIIYIMMEYMLCDNY